MPPRLYFASLTSASGRVCSIALVVTHWKTEGSAIFERVAPDGKALEAIENGTWRVTDGPEGASVLSIEWPSDGGEVDLAITDLLMMDLAQQMGCDAYEKQGDR